MHNIAGERFGVRLSQVDAALGEDLDGYGIDLVSRVRPGGTDVDAAGRQVLGERGRHLRPPGVLDADEQQLRYRFGDLACRLRRSGELFTGEAGDQDWQESAMRAVGSRAARASATAWAIDALENVPSYVYASSSMSES